MIESRGWAWSDVLVDASNNIERLFCRLTTRHPWQGPPEHRRQRWWKVEGDFQDWQPTRPANNKAVAAVHKYGSASFHDIENLIGFTFSRKRGWGILQIFNKHPSGSTGEIIQIPPDFRPVLAKPSGMHFRDNASPFPVNLPRIVFVLALAMDRGRRARQCHPAENPRRQHGAAA